MRGRVPDGVMRVVVRYEQSCTLLPFSHCPLSAAIALLSMFAKKQSARQLCRRSKDFVSK